MNNWIIEPRDPLITRDGKPFSATPGARASSLPFPYPSTTTGTVRTRAGSNAEGVFVARPEDVIKLAVCGPLLVELDDNGEIFEWLAPAPADALLQWNDEAGEVIRQRLVPLVLNGAQTDLDSRYHVVGMVQPEPLKPYGKAPRFWHWSAFEQWLLQPPAESHKGGEPITRELGHNGPVPETRTHVKIDPASQAAEESFLFQTRGMEFTQVKDPERPFRDAPRRLGLAVAAAPEAVMSEGVATLGGERRSVFWRASQKPLMPDCPPALPSQIATAGHCRVVLLTPAIFKDGWQPDEDPPDASSPHALLAARNGVEPVLKAAALPRYQVISGWDYENKCPKPTRRMMPAGSVLFLELQEAVPGQPGDIEAWVKAVWRSCVSDAKQDCLDGFGLAALGVWSGVPQSMEVIR